MEQTAPARATSRADGHDRCDRSLATRLPRRRPRVRETITTPRSDLHVGDRVAFGVAGSDDGIMRAAAAKVSTDTVARFERGDEGADD